MALNRALLRSGAPIDRMNCVRKHISAIKGGRLAAAAYPARVVCLMISDVPFDDPSVIASGPTVPDPTTVHDALGILEHYKIDIPTSVREMLEGEGGVRPPNPGIRFSRMLKTSLFPNPLKCSRPLSAMQSISG